ncbi:urea carboxylase-associated family protein [Paraburkholderia terrae]|uniref:urea carboxylase-associated family protein n=1 Tax=Paraburkholderia terrae TaxID=311230 RepID=UPI00296AD728|nr:urea carboxylase-associated family protein [Paraburkholderia terrae]MDW3656798.1 urea carboxylase-associated family protein [Paraburkholderia terrae]
MSTTATHTHTHTHTHPSDDNGTELGQNATLHEPISADGTPELGKPYTVPARCGRAVRVKAGQTIRIANPHGTQVCDTWIFNATHLNEFLSFEHTRAYIDKIIPQPGDPLVTNHRRPIAELVADTSPGIHDTLMAACDLYRYQNLGVESYHDNCSDNLRLALKAIGLRTREVPQPFNLWMNIPVKPDYTVDWLPPVSKAGDHVDIKAAMDCIVVMSACPQDIIPINALNPVEVEFTVLA